MQRPRILVFASGEKTVELGGGSGFQELVEFSRTSPPVLDADIVAVVSNYARGGVSDKADKLGVDFVHWPGPFDALGYQHHVKMFQAGFVMCSGWIKLVQGLYPNTTVNIHPAPLPEFGGPGMWGHYVHEAVIQAFREGTITQSAVSMHFVIDRGADKKAYDKGPIIFQFPVLIREEDTAKTLAERVNEKERAWQACILNLVVHKRIWLEGEDERDWEVFHTCPELAKFIPGRYLPPGAEIHNTPKFSVREIPH